MVPEYRHVNIFSDELYWISEYNLLIIYLQNKENIMITEVSKRKYNIIESIINKYGRYLEKYSFYVNVCFWNGYYNVNMKSLKNNNLHLSGVMNCIFKCRLINEANKMVELGLINKKMFSDDDNIIYSRNILGICHLYQFICTDHSCEIYKLLINNTSMTREMMLNIIEINVMLIRYCNINLIKHLNLSSIELYNFVTKINGKISIFDDSVTKNDLLNLMEYFSINSVLDIFLSNKYLHAYILHFT